MSLSKSPDAVADTTEQHSGSAAAQVPAAQVAALHQAAVDYVVRATGLSLDGSEESLAIVDHYLERVRPGGVEPLKPDVLRLVAAALGVYLGELMISRFGGIWRVHDSAEASAVRDEFGALAGWRVELVAAPLLVDPISMAAAALRGAEEAPAEDATDEDEEDETPGFTLAAEALHLHAPLLAALARLAPVSSEYYYSLTGRFETLTYVVDLVTDLRHQEDARAAAVSAGQAAAAPGPPEHQ